MLNYSADKIVLALATAIGSIGMMPKPPTVVSRLGNEPSVQWFLLFVLIYQGGGGQDVKFSAMITALVYAIYQVLETQE